MASLRMRVFAALLLVLQLVQPALMQCSFGAKGDGTADDTDALQKVDNDASIGIIYLSNGTYRITRNLDLRKPVMATAGAMFKVEASATLTLWNQPQHPFTQFFTGAGRVVFADGTQFVLPEWFGAKANGKTDDSLPIQLAYDATKGKGNAMVYLKGTYGIGPAREIAFGTPSALIVAGPDAKFVAVAGNTKGVTFLPGNYGVKYVLPHFVGFSDFCAQLLGASLGAFQFKTLSNCGDAIRLASNGTGMHCLDNTIWFERIENSRVGIAIRAEPPSCSRDNCIFQGNQVTGGSIIGGASSGNSYGILMSSLAIPCPAWDSNNFDIEGVVPPTNPAYRVFAAIPKADREILKIKSLAALPHAASKVFGEGKIDGMQVIINHAAPLKEHQFGLYGELNLVELRGAGLTPAGTKIPVRCTNAPNTKAQFNNNQSLHGTYNTLQAVPTTDWRSGEVRQFFFYHQAANGLLYQIKCGAIKSNITNLQQIECVQYSDNGARVPDEVSVWLINQSGGTVKALTPATFSIAVNTLGMP